VHVLQVDPIGLVITAGEFNEGHFGISSIHYRRRQWTDTAKLTAGLMALLLKRTRRLVLGTKKPKF
jgi:hypothetical protein